MGKPRHSPGLFDHARPGEWALMKYVLLLARDVGFLGLAGRCRLVDVKNRCRRRAGFDLLLLFTRTLITHDTDLPANITPSIENAV